MARIDRWPSTPVKQLTAWVAFCLLFLFSLAVMWWNRLVNTEIFVTVWTAVLAYGGIALGQFWVKRATAWEPPAEPTKSEASQPVTEGQPTVPAAVVDADKDKDK